ncbi:MAG TPA: ABC transporter ATP-binding protein [Candidatus Krumholzibacteria bacterium]|nr:ABC transporter ATP-binding protein [Candidatus Krumholzibacteria bacterium]HPD72149.1 ABC transporter ATP-binding protein [Candidatus Krumholzibacteria bacterium]HRY40919.1 ABC transporter ATP-binding protein [Candidatus Krumholzibacteria bacterium]
MTADSSNLQVEHLTFAYRREPVLRDVSFVLERGAVGLLGPNGSGKTTLLRALLGQVPVRPGQVRVQGHDMAHEARLGRRSLGWMPERGGIIPGLSGVALTAYLGELSGMARQDAMQRAHEVLHFVGLRDERYRSCETYSQGMRQRLKLAGALVHDPRWLLLDEPTSGLDPGGRVDMLDLVADLAGRKGLGVILSTHLLADVEAVCREILVLREGRLLDRQPVAGHDRGGQQVFEISGFGGEEAFVEALARLALSVKRDGRHITAVLDLDTLPAGPGNPTARAMRAVLELAVACDYSPRRLRRRPVTLADEFHALVNPEAR